MQINVVVLSGQAAADTTTEVLPNGTMKASFILEQFESYTHKGEKKVKRHSIQVECWAETAKIAAEWIGKGKQLTVKGSLQSNSWKDSNGKWVNKHVIKADSFDLIGPKCQPGQVDSNF
jgi:single-strand DNA-binding protein